MRIVAYPNPSASANWRLTDPFKYLRKKGIEAIVSDVGITDELAEWGDIHVLQGVVDKNYISTLYAYQQEKGKKIVVEQDDYLKVQDDNIHRIEHEKTNAVEVIAKTMQIADGVTTTTHNLAYELRKYNKNVCVLPNYLDLERWNLPKLTNDSKTIRIGWAGSATHLEDIRMIEQPIKRVLSEFPNTQLIIVGDPRIADLFKGYNVEFMLGVEFAAWPERLNTLRIDIGLAPLRDTLFNQCKSNIKWLEYSVAKIPGIFSPTVYYMRHFEPNLGFIARSENDWYTQLKTLVTSKVLRDDMAHASHTMAVARYSLEKHIDDWVSFYKDLTPS